MIAITIIAVFTVIGITAAVIIISLARAEIKKAEIEKNMEVAKKALSNEVLRVAISDIEIKVPWIMEREYDGHEREIFRHGYQEGAEAIRDKAKRIVQNTRSE